MERRRNRSFVPGWQEPGLEERQLLSTVSTAAKQTPAEKAASQKAAQAAAKLQRQQAAYDNAVKIRNQRINRLPAFMRSIQPGRFVPDETITSIQTQLRLILGQLAKPNPSVSTAFVRQIRSTIADASIGVGEANQINNSFGRLLTSARAPQGVIDTLRADMNELVRVDVGSRNPPFLVSNDYTLVMQTALAVGKPLPKVGPT